MNLNKIEDKTIIKAAKYLILSLGIFSLIQFLAVLYDLFFSGGGPSVLRVFSLFAVSKKCSRR